MEGRIHPPSHELGCKILPKRLRQSYAFNKIAYIRVQRNETNASFLHFLRRNHYLCIIFTDKSGDILCRTTNN